MKTLTSVCALLYPGIHVPCLACALNTLHWLAEQRTSNVPNFIHQFVCISVCVAHCSTHAQHSCVAGVRVARHVLDIRFLMFWGSA